MAVDIKFLKEFIGFLGTKGIDPETLNNDQEMWKVLRMYEESTQQIMGKGDVMGLKDYFYNKAFRTNKDLMKVESKGTIKNIKEDKAMKRSDKKGLNEAALTDFTINAQVDVEGLGSGKVILITPDSVTIKFADDTDKTFLADETYKVTVKAPEEEPAPEGEVPVEVPAQGPVAEPEVQASMESIKKAVKNVIEAVKLIDSKTSTGFASIDKSFGKIKESVFKIASAVRLLNEGDAAIASADPGVGGEGTPADDKGAIDQTPDKEQGGSIPPTNDPDKKLSTPEAIAAESKRLAKKLGISEKSAFEIIKKALLEDEVGDGGAGIPADDKDKIDQVPNVPAGEEIPATNDPDKSDSVPAPTTQEAKRKAKVAVAIDEMKIMAGVKKHKLLG